MSELCDKVSLYLHDKVFVRAHRRRGPLLHDDVGDLEVSPEALFFQDPDGGGVERLRQHRKTFQLGVSRPENHPDSNARDQPRKIRIDRLDHYVLQPGAWKVKH